MITDKLNNYFENKAQYGTLLLRLVIGWRLIAGTWSYAFFVKPMAEVEGHFASMHLPFPLVSAYLSVYAQLICGILFIIGLWVRPAAIVMIFNFIVAIIAAHTQDPIVKSFAAWVMIAGSAVFLFFGAGNLSLDKYLSGNKRYNSAS